ncbi:MAG: hypothetical protein E7297_09040 [Lachnospiraceae bacterium]|nr:hypothetical protein [Lachnospiraceae bacterium]
MIRQNFRKALLATVMSLAFIASIVPVTFVKAANDYVYEEQTGSITLSESGGSVSFDVQTFAKNGWRITQYSNLSASGTGTISDLSKSGDIIQFKLGPMDDEGTVNISFTVTEVKKGDEGSNSGVAMANLSENPIACVMSYSVHRSVTDTTETTETTESKEEPQVEPQPEVDPTPTPKPAPDPAETKTVEPAPKPSQQPTTTDNTQPANPAPTASQDTAPAASQDTASAAEAQVASAAQAAVETAPVQVAAAVDPAPKQEEGVVAGTKHAKEGSEATVAEKKEDAEPEIVTLDLTDISEDKAQVTKDVLQEYAGKNVKLELTLSETAKWVIDASTIDAEKVQDIDLGIVRDADGIPAETLDAFMENPKLSEATLTEQISLRHDGLFGFSADLYLLVGKEYQGKYANLFYYNPETKALEFVAAKEVGEDGYASFPFVHASDYAVIVDRAPLGDLISDPNAGVNLVDDSSEAVQSSEINVEEQTVEGGARWVGLMMILLIITAIIVVFLMVHMIYKADNPDYDNQYARKKA